MTAAIPPSPEPTAATTRLERARAVASALLGVLGRQTQARVGLGESADLTLADDFVNTLEALGVTFVKFGQTLSSRKDLLPDDYIAALSRLQDDVAPVSWEDAAAVLQAAWGKHHDLVLRSIDPTPIGSASIGQVHRAVLLDGREVAVKIQRPGARATVAQDVALLQSLGNLGVLGPTIDFQELVADFQASLELELDYRVEASNLLRLRKTMKDHPHLSVPRPILELTAQTVLVMDYIEGQPLAAVTHFRDGPELARDLCSSYFDQILDAGFFHADPHLGNLVYADGRLHILDLGLVETLTPEERTQIARLVMNLTEGAGDQVARDLEGMCTPLEGHDRNALRADVDRTVRRATALRGIEPTFGDTIFALLRACTDNHFKPPMRLAALARTLSMLDTVFSRLDPHFDPGQIVTERSSVYARDHLLGDLGSSFGARQGMLLSQLLQHGPQHLEQILGKLADGTFTVKVDAIDEHATLASLQSIANRIAGALIVAALLLAGAMLADSAGPQIFGMPVESVVFLVLGGFGAVTLLLSILWFDPSTTRRNP